jgi:hypothetical protein
MISLVKKRFETFAEFELQRKTRETKSALLGRNRQRTALNIQLMPILSFKFESLQRERADCWSVNSNVTV